MKLKQIFIALGALLCISSIGIYVQSCSSDESDTTEFTKDQKHLIEKYAIVGKEHNDAMAVIFNSLIKDTKSTNMLKGKDLAEAVKQKTVQVLQSKGYNTEIINFDIFFNTNKGQTKSAYEDYMTSTIFNNGRSEKFKEIVKELVRVSDDYELSIQEHKNKVSQLNKLAFSTLNDEELDYFLIGSSTACASFEYWHTHFQEWYDLLGGYFVPRVKVGNERDYWEPACPNGTSANYGICHGMVGADIGGAIGGAMSGAIAAAVTAGVSVVGTAVASGVGSSAGVVINNIIEHYF